MSETIEERLTAALEARAEQITSDDLRPLEVPSPARRISRGAAIALVAAAVAAAIAIPIAITRLGDGEAGQGPVGHPSTPPPTQAHATATYEPPAGLRNVKTVSRETADVDGDRQADEVTLHAGRLPRGTFGGWVEVTVASGETGAAPWPDGYTPDLLRSFAIDGDGREQVLLSQSGGDAAQLLVYTWIGDRLVHATKTSRAPLALELGEGKYADYYTDDGGLHSWLRGQPAKPGGFPMFHVQVWTWSIDGEQLTAEPEASACVDVTSQNTPSPCD
jgi:hypothetical protein